MFSHQQISHFRAFEAGGIRGDYLPLSVDRAPLSQALIADDPRLFQGSVALLDTPTVPKRAATGALLVVPGSHDPAFGARVQRYRSLDPALQGFAPWPLPATAVETDPGDVIAFHRHLFHSSDGGSKRLAWTVEYLPWPGVGDPARLEAVRRAVVDAVDHDHLGYEAERWPTWREWAAASAGCRPARRRSSASACSAAVDEGAR